MDSAIEKMERSVGMMISWSKMFTAFTKLKDAVSSIAYLLDFIVNWYLGLQRFVTQLNFFPGCDNSEFAATTNRKSCPRNFECMGADDTCFPRPIGKDR